MEKRHLAIIHRKYSEEIEGKSIVVLNISDDYQYMDSELIEILKSRLSEHLNFGERE